MTTLQPAKSAPEPIVLEGRFVRLEPLAPRHAEGIFAISTMPGGTERYRWLFSTAPETLDEVEARIAATTWGENRYVADGTLDLRGVKKPLSLPFSLKIDGDTATARGVTTLDRTVFGVGQGEWASTDQIAANVKVNFALTAKRK